MGASNRKAREQPEQLYTWEPGIFYTHQFENEVYMIIAIAVGIGSFLVGYLAHVAIAKWFAVAETGCRKRRITIEVIKDLAPKG